MSPRGCALSISASSVSRGSAEGSGCVRRTPHSPLVGTAGLGERVIIRRANASRLPALGSQLPHFLAPVC